MTNGKVTDMTYVQVRALLDAKISTAKIEKEFGLSQETIQAIKESKNVGDYRTTIARKKKEEQQPIVLKNDTENEEKTDKKMVFGTNDEPNKEPVEEYTLVIEPPIDGKVMLSARDYIWFELQEREVAALEKIAAVLERK